MPSTSPKDISEPTVAPFTSEEEAHFKLKFEEGFDLYDPRYTAWLECNHPEAVLADHYSLVPAPSHSENGHEIPSSLPHFSSVDPTDPLQFSDETTLPPTVSTTLRSDLPGPLRPSETMPSPVLFITLSPVVSTTLRSDLQCHLRPSDTMPSPVVSTTPLPVVSTPLRSDLPGPLGPSETMPPPVDSTPLSSNRLGFLWKL